MLLSGGKLLEFFSGNAGDDDDDDADDDADDDNERIGKDCGLLLTSRKVSLNMMNRIIFMHIKRMKKAETWQQVITIRTKPAKHQSQISKNKCSFHSANFSCFSVNISTRL